MNKNYFDLLRLWLRSYFKHPLENIRQARPIVPGRLYRNFGNACKAVLYTAEERRYIKEMSWDAKDNPSLSNAALMELVRYTRGSKQSAKELERLVQSDLPPRCTLCDFHNKGIPCPLYNELADGSTVCDTHRYIIIKSVSHV